MARSPSIRLSLTRLHANVAPAGAYPRSLVGINRTNGVEQREAPENVQRSVTAFLKPSRLCEPE